LATNPVFPEVATRARVKFAGIAPESFKLITTYENSHFAKPRREYYEEILNSLGLCAEECVMVGNDTSDDLPAASLGMRVFILEHCLINKGNIDYSAVPHGGFAELMDFIRSLV
jgi:FMN phosphatase YigB (HAD superfamily)